MKIILLIILITIIVLGYIIIQYIFKYNKLQSLNIKINEAESIIDEELRNKYDLIMRSSRTINKLLKKEVTYFKELEELKNKNISNFNFAYALNSNMLFIPFHKPLIPKKSPSKKIEINSYKNLINVFINYSPP